MPPRFTYRRLEPETFEMALQTVGISAREFAKLSGAPHHRVGQWLRGENDIPPWVMVFMTMLTVPKALDIARAAANETIIRDNENMHLGEYPFRNRKEPSQ